MQYTVYTRYSDDAIVVKQMFAVSGAHIRVRSLVRPFVRLSVRLFVRVSVRPFVRSSVVLASMGRYETLELRQDVKRSK